MKLGQLEVRVVEGQLLNQVQQLSPFCTNIVGQPQLRLQVSLELAEQLAELFIVLHAVRVNFCTLGLPKLFLIHTQIWHKLALVHVHNLDQEEPPRLVHEEQVRVPRDVNGSEAHQIRLRASMLHHRPVAYFRARAEALVLH